MPPAPRPLSHRERSPAQPARAGDEVDVLDEAALLVLHRDDHRGEARDVVAAAGSRKTRLRARRIANERAVQIAVLIDLRSAHEADVDVAALQQQQHFSAAEDHVRACRAALIVGRRRQSAGLDERADHAALEQDRQARTPQALRERRGEERNADSGKHDLAVLEVAVRSGSPAAPTPSSSGSG